MQEEAEQQHKATQLHPQLCESFGSSSEQRCPKAALLSPSSCSDRAKSGLAHHQAEVSGASGVAIKKKEKNKKTSNTKGKQEG